jgi:hypothetical protein
MNCPKNVNSILPTQLPHKFSYIVAIFIHNHFESPNSKTDNNALDIDSISNLKLRRT